MEAHEILDILQTHLNNHKMPSVSQIAEKRRDPFAVLVSTVISLRTKDEVTVPAAMRLLEKAPTPKLLSTLSEEEISSLIYPAGFYKTKAKNLKQIARILIAEYDSLVPSEMDKLLALPGVGRKTANLVRNLSYGLPGICVDTHVHRISNRLGWVKTKNPHETETALMKVLPVTHWIAVNEILIKFGQTVCAPVSPFCSRCPVDKYCKKIGVSSYR
jgi:endonuclease-3